MKEGNSNMEEMIEINKLYEKAMEPDSIGQETTARDILNKSSKKYFLIF